jgi:hypothetical protein
VFARTSRTPGAGTAAPRSPPRRGALHLLIHADLAPVLSRRGFLLSPAVAFLYFHAGQDVSVSCRRFGGIVCEPEQGCASLRAQQSSRSGPSM